MPVNLQAPQAHDLLAVRGVSVGTAMAGIRKADRRDLTVFLLDPGTQVAGVFTRNRFCAAPVQICRRHLSADQEVRALLINTGNANAGTGEDGMRRAQDSCEALARALALSPGQVLPFSTGVIMETLPSERLIAGLPAALADARALSGSPLAWLQAAQAIMTTDTLPKAVSRQLFIDGQAVTITGISKGAGMIRPNMATMLGFVATDAVLAPGLLQTLVQQVADASFNCISVDGDTSTNDSFMLMATGQAGHAPITQWDSAAGQSLKEALQDVAVSLAQAIVRDGEGATKFITIEVDGGRHVDECRQVAYAIAQSPLVKTAFHASDPNLGRILAAVGYAGLDDLDPGLIDLSLGDVPVVSQGGRRLDYREEDGQRAMAPSDITVRVGLGRGAARATVWTCDFSAEYVRINADYRS